MENRTKSVRNKWEYNARATIARPIGSFVFFFVLASLDPQIKRRKNTGETVSLEVGFIVLTITLGKEVHCLKYPPVKPCCFNAAREVAGGGYAACLPCCLKCLETFTVAEWYLTSVKLKLVYK